VMEEAHAAALLGNMIAQSPVSLDITVRTEYGSEAGATSCTNLVDRD
jgi:NADH:ubiquinone oxidoreductase subunit F (NADH-binding)